MGCLGALRAVMALLAGSGWCQTLERLGAAPDIAGPVAFLVSEDVGWVDGQVIGAKGITGGQPRATNQEFDGHEAPREAPG